MKKGNLRTIKRYNKSSSTKYAIEVRVNKIWRKALDKNKRELIFDHEYDACAKLLSFFEKEILQKESMEKNKQ